MSALDEEVAKKTYRTHSATDNEYHGLAMGVCINDCVNA